MIFFSLNNLADITVTRLHMLLVTVFNCLAAMCRVTYVYYIIPYTISCRFVTLT